MQLYRGIFHPDRQSDGISTIPYGSNTLTCQYDNMNVAPMEPLHGQVTRTLAQIYTAYTSKSTVPEYPPTSRSPQALFDVSGIQI